jgi:hypothetical protein
MGLRSETRRERTASGKTIALSPNWGLAPIQFFEEDQDCQILINPGSPGHRPALKAGLRVSGFLVFSESARIAALNARQETRESDSRQRAALGEQQEFDREDYDRGSPTGISRQ